MECNLFVFFKVLLLTYTVSITKNYHKSFRKEVCAFVFLKMQTTNEKANLSVDLYNTYLYKSLKCRTGTQKSL